MPYLREALHLIEEGFGVADVDAAMRAFGMPMGPLEVLDEVGLDVAAKVAAILSRAFPERMTAAPLLEALVGAGRLGRKSGAGFYRHRGAAGRAGGRRPDAQALRSLGLARERRTASREALAERMTLVMVNEAARCLAEGVVADAGALDLAMVYGSGFPAFRGGPLRHADSLGLAKVEARLTALRAEKGERFRPAPLVTKLAAAGGTFTSPLAL
jgi:3-hydroxyacyl-CoA dehydrogenase/enoyl-CoA hydratase/3-hydroxybutyryl-CoA epimerase